MQAWMRALVNAGVGAATCGILKPTVIRVYFKTSGKSRRAVSSNTRTAAPWCGFDSRHVRHLPSLNRCPWYLLLDTLDTLGTLGTGGVAHRYR